MDRVSDSALLRLSAQRAMWDRVPAGLRAVAVVWEGIGVRARWVFERPPDESLLEEIRIAETEVLADMSEGVNVRFLVEELPMECSPVLQPEEQWVYMRHEDECIERLGTGNVTRERIFLNKEAGTYIDPLTGNRTPTKVVIAHRDSDDSVHFVPARPDSTKRGGGGLSHIGDFLSYLFLSLQRALLGQVVQELRAISIRSEGYSATIRFLHLGEPSRTALEMIEDVKTNLAADMPPEAEVVVLVEGSRPGTPRVLGENEQWFFLRRESN